MPSGSPRSGSTRRRSAKRYGYRDFTDDGPQQEVRAFIGARAWTRTEGPRALFDQSVAWLREQKIPCPTCPAFARASVTLAKAARRDTRR